MIRINLHPVRQQKKVQAGKRQLLLLGLVVAGQVAAMFLFYTWRSGLVDDKAAQMRQLEARKAALQKEVGDFDRLRSQRDRLIAQRNIINTLEKARSGPVAMLRELSDVLTRGKGPRVDEEEYEKLLRRDANAGFNPRWNAHRLWVEHFVEQGGQVSIRGRAKDYDDVAEFTKRINLSTHFTDESLQRNDQVMDRALGLKVVQFSIRAKTTY